MNSILFRYMNGYEDEYKACREVFGDSMYSQRTSIPEGSCVIGRYSVLPFYDELQKDLLTKDAFLINSYFDHLYIANFEYISDISDFTFQTWEDRDFYRAPEGPYVVKGKTNSRKESWSTHMFAPDKHTALEISSKLMSDPLIAQQGIIYRKYEKLMEVTPSFYGYAPYTNEWRIFFLFGNIVAYDYYWSNVDQEDIPDFHKYRQEFISNGLPFACAVSQKISIPFYVMDVGQKENGDWVVIELNDAQMSGLSCIEPKLFYESLYQHLQESK